MIKKYDDKSWRGLLFFKFNLSVVSHVPRLDYKRVNSNCNFLCIFRVVCSPFRQLFYFLLVVLPALSSFTFPCSCPLWILVLITVRGHLDCTVSRAFEQCNNVICLLYKSQFHPECIASIINQIVRIFLYDLIF